MREQGDVGEKAKEVVTWAVNEVVNRHRDSLALRKQY